MARCPACHAPAAELPVQQFSATEAAQHFVLAEEFPERHAQLVAHIRQLWGTDRCSRMRCAACGLRFAWPFVAGDGLFYNLAYPHSDYPSERWEFDETVRALRAAPVPDGPVLEIGSGFGYFLRKISPTLVPADRVVAVEYNDVARAALRERGFTAHGEDIRSASFDSLRGRLAAVFLFQVLEHMDDLDGVVQRLNQLMRPGASLFIAVPNAQRIDYNETHDSLYDMPPNHISLWTEGAFRALAARAGWTLVAHRSQPTLLRDFVKADLVYAYMRRAQRSGSLANRLRARPRSRVRVALEGALALAAAPARVAAWAEAWGHRDALGSSVWVHLRAPGA